MPKQLKGNLFKRSMRFIMDERKGKNEKCSLVTLVGRIKTVNNDQKLSCVEIARDLKDFLENNKDIVDFSCQLCGKFNDKIIELIEEWKIIQNLFIQNIKKEQKTTFYAI